MFELKEGKFLISVARRIVNNVLNKNSEIRLSQKIPEKLRSKFGAFITLHKVEDNMESKKIFCVGFPWASRPLIEVIRDLAINTAVRARSLSKLNVILDNVTFDIHVITSMQLISVRGVNEYPKMLKIGSDGILIQLYFYQGVLLPHTIVENNWDEIDCLCQCCLDAGLPMDAWLRRDIKIYKFQTELFKELPNGKIIKVGS